MDNQTIKESRRILEFRGLILAAGRGRRFASEAVAGAEGENFPKVLRPALGKPLVSYVIQALKQSGVADITLIIGYGAEHVRDAFGPSYRYVLQPEQKGSGHAVMCAKDQLEPLGGHLIVMCGDSPLVTPDTVKRLMQEHASSSAVITLTSAVLDDPFGYGRIIRDSSGRIVKIAEEKASTDEEKQVREINGGMLAFDADWLWQNIDRMQINEAGEYNLTDMVRIAISDHETVSAAPCHPEEVLGVNTPAQLEVVEGILKGRGQGGLG